LCEDVIVDNEDDNAIVLAGRFGTERIGGSDRIVREVLRRMELGPVLPENAWAPPGRAWPVTTGATPRLSSALARLSHMVVRTLGLDDLRGPLLSVTPTAADATFVLGRVPGERRMRLSPDASMVVGAAGIVLASPGAKHEVVLHRPEAAWVVAMLAWPVTADEAAAVLPLPRTVVYDVLGYLVAADMAVPADG
jgi:hypothetical protein